MMNDWPSQWDLFWLAVGLLPVAYVLLKVRRRGIAELANLSFSFVVITWIGYHATPWLALETGDWRSFLLRPLYITDGLMLSTVAMVAFLFGYRKRRSRTRDKGPYLRVSLRDTLSHNAPKNKWIIALACLSFALFIINIGGPHQLWQATYDRGDGQFDRSTEAQIRNVLLIVGKFIHVSLALISSLSLFSLVDQKRIATIITGLVGLTVATLPSAHSFSRGTGYALGLAAFIGLLVRDWRAIFPIVLPFIMLAAWLSWTGYTQRGNFRPGVGTFIEAMVCPREADATSEPIETSLFANPALNPLNALDAFTARAWSKEFAAPLTFIEGLVDLTAALQPIPSHIVPFDVRAGSSLSDVFGMHGTVGLTTPALGELYYWFGFSGALLLWPYGRFCRWIDGRRQLRGDAISILTWVGTLLGFAVGLHSGVRAMTRFTVYPLVFMILTRPFQRRRFHVAPYTRGGTAMGGK